MATSSKKAPPSEPPGSGGSNLTKYLIWGLGLLALAIVVFMLMRPAGGSAPTGVQDVGNAEFEKAIVAGYQLIDVRTAQEYAAGHIPGAIDVPIEVLPQRLASIDKSKPVAVYCATGARSLNAKQFLAAQGYATVVNLKQGIVAWDGPTVSGTAPGAAASAAAGSDSSGGGSSGAAVTVKTSGIPVLVDLSSPT